MIRDSLGLVAAALASQTDWKATMTSSGTWVIKKRPRQPLEPNSEEERVEGNDPQPASNPMSESVMLFV